MLTPEQCYAIDYAMKRLPTKFIAFAGAGKTSTLVNFAIQMKTYRGLYMAFNTSVATDARLKFPYNVECRTTHSLAFRAVADRGFDPERKLRKSPKSWSFDISCVKDKLPVNPDIFKSIVASVLTRFCQSDSRSITEFFVPRVPGMTTEVQEFFYKWAPVAAADVWSHMTDPADDMPLGGDGYVKLWALSNPRLRFDFILVDEAQDTNGVVLGVIRNQEAQIIAVGDSHQQIYAWRGAKDALTILPGHECRLTKSFRFGDQIAAAANGVLTAMGEKYPLHGHSVIRDTVSGGRPAGVDAVLVRTNTGLIENAFRYLDAGRIVYTPKGAGELRALVDDADGLQNGRLPKAGELLGFETWSKVQEYAATDEGASLKVFVNLVGKYGCSKLRRVLEQIRDKPVTGCVTLATGHKAKGLEWPSVAINDDFMRGDAEDDDANISLEERRLFYVAITRAQHHLHVDPLTLERFSDIPLD